MEIEIKISRLVPQEHLIEAVRILLKEISANFPLNQDTLRFVVADEFSMLEEIRRVEPSAGMTNNDTILATGKTISKKCDGIIKHHVFLNENVVGAAIASGMGVHTDGVSEVDNLQYVIYHELAHCYDNKQRENFEHECRLNTSTFCIEKLSDHYLPIVIDEFFASVFSSFAVSNSLFKFQNDEFCNMVNEFTMKTDEIKRQYVNDVEVTNKLAFSAAQDAWFVLVQYSKLIGYAVGNSQLRSASVELWDNAGDTMKVAIEKLAELLGALVKEYPTLPAGIEDEVCAIWNSVALSMGYKFMQTDEGDAVYFNR